MRSDWLLFVLVCGLLAAGCAQPDVGPCSPSGRAIREGQFVAEVLLACDGLSRDTCPGYVAIRDRYRAIRTQCVGVEEIAAERAVDAALKERAK